MPPLEDYDMVPIRRIRFATPQNFFRSDEDRKISVISNISEISADYCEVITDFDEAQGENDSFIGSNDSTQSALNSINIGLTDNRKTTDVEMVATKANQEVNGNLKRENVLVTRNVNDTASSPLNLSTILSEKL